MGEPTRAMAARRVLAIVGYGSASRSMPNPQAELLWGLHSRGIELRVLDLPGFTMEEAVQNQIAVYEDLMRS
jgi:hypothetical protein